jgi:hypothetical protein
MIGSLDSRGGCPHRSLCFHKSISRLMILPVRIVADSLGICKTVLGSSI